MNVNDFLLRARAEISDNPQTRVPQTVNAIINDADTLFDIHMHIFDKNYTAKNFILLRMLEALDNKKSRAEMIENFYKKHEDNSFEEILQILDYNNMQGILQFYYKAFSYQQKMIVTPLTMDMRNWILKPRKSMLMQINEMKDLIPKYPILPFLATDPHSSVESGSGNLYRLFLKAFTGDHKFFGVKIYPALGYLPSHPALLPIYQICAEKNIPVTTHGGGTIIRAKKTKVSLSGYQIIGDHVEPYEVVPPKKPKEFARFLNNPALWEPVLKMFPNLKLNLGHFGGVEIWEPNGKDPQNRYETINRLLGTYPNVYGDFSFNFADTSAVPKFIATLQQKPLFKNRAMFGTDFWVVLSEGEARTDQISFIDELTRQGLKKTLMVENPKRFLLG